MHKDDNFVKINKLRNKCMRTQIHARPQFIPQDKRQSASTEFFYVLWATITQQPRATAKQQH